VDPDGAFLAFRSRAPNIAALAHKRGFAGWLPPA
jgi:hypothetical protein